MPPTAALGSFLRKELGGALRIGPKDLTPLSSVAYGATPFLGKGAINCGEAATFPLERQRTQPFYTTRRRRRPQPEPSGAPLFYLRRSRHHNPLNLLNLLNLLNPHAQRACP